MPCCNDNATSNEDIEMKDNKNGVGRKYEANFRGPINKRSCTDIICCLLFIVCLGGLAVVSYFALTRGDIRILLYPTDSQGKLCGYGNFTDKKYLVFFDMIECAKKGAASVLGGCPTPQVCVKQCPKTNWVWLTLFAEESAKGVNITKRSEQLYCVDSSYQNPSISLQNLIASKKCAPYLLESSAFAGRCIPTIFKNAFDLIQGVLTNNNETIRTADNTTVTFGAIKNGSQAIGYLLNALGIAQNAFNDVQTSWYLILIGIGIGAVVSFIWCLLVRCVAGVMVFGTLFIFFFVFGGATGYCVFQYFNSTRTISSLGNDFFTQNYQTYLALKETWLALGIIAGIFFLIILIVLVCLRNRIRLAIGIIREASKAVASITFTLIFPIWPFIFQLAVVAYICMNVLFLSATGKAVSLLNGTEIVCNESLQSELHCQFIKYGGNDWSFYLQAYNLFMGFWLTCFVVGLNQLILAGTFASWYWAFEKPKDVPNFPILSSVWRAIRYHLGTVAFGSLILAIVKMIRAILAYIEHKLEGRDNCLIKFLLCCLKCCFWCLEKCLKFLTKNAYIVTAIYGKNFCSAAKDAFMLILRNCVRVVVVDNVTTFVFFVGKLLVTGAVTVGAFFFFNGSITFLSTYNPTLNYFFVPVIVIAVGTYIVATIFFSVFSFAVDTLFICVMEDLERNDGTKDKPYFMSKSLMKILDVDNKFRDGADKKDESCCCC